MAGKIDYKSKYQELKAKFMSSDDAAWQDGYQHGMQDSQVDQANQQQAQADQMASQTQPQPGEESESSEEAQSDQPQSQNPNGDELDQHIQKLESMLGKAELASTDLGELKKTLADIRSLQVQINLAKSLASIKSTKLSPLKKSLSFSPRVQANLPEPAKKALSLQENIVKNVFEKWEKDEQKASSDITNILNIDGIVKKD